MNDQLIIHSLIAYPSYEWSTGSAERDIIVHVPGQYALEVKDNNGCIGKDTIEVFPTECFLNVAIPTAFSPNGDQLNDIFRATVHQPLVVFRLEVFNRYGQRIFFTTDPHKGWDGTLGGKAFSSDVFVWQCRYQFPGKKAEFQKGTVTLIR